MNVNVPPGGPEVIPFTPIKASFVTPPLLVSMVGLPVSDRLWNLNAAIGRWFGSAKNSVSMFNAVSKAEVEPKAHSEKAPSSVWAAIDFAVISHAIGGDRRIGRNDRSVRD